MEIKSKEDLINLLTAQQSELQAMKTQLEALTAPTDENPEGETPEGETPEGDGEGSQEEIDEIEQMLSDI